MWWRRSWFSLKGKAGIPGQTEGRPATSIGPRVPPLGSLQQRGRRSKRVHSRYERTLADLPWGEYAVTVRLKVRRLFCDAPCCERRLFAERLPGVAAPWARKTVRLADRLTAVGLALGGAAGARLGRTLGLTASRNTLL